MAVIMSSSNMYLCRVQACGCSGKAAIQIEQHIHNLGSVSATFLDMILILF